MPFFLLFSLCLVTGTSYAFALTAFFLIGIPMVIFNVGSIQTDLFVANNIVRAILGAVFFVLLFLWLLNIWTIIPATDPYFLTDSI